MTPRVELIFDPDCPNAEAARDQLRQALTQLGEKPAWTEWDRSDDASPAYSREYGSPTILVNGRDVTGSETSDGNCCRIYRGSSGALQGVPPLETIVTALEGASQSAANAASGWRAWLAVVPAAGIALLPNLTCPACWPAYAALLSAVGLGVLLNASYLLPLTALALTMALGGLGHRAGSRRGYGPFLIGLLAATAILVGKFIYSSDTAMYSGVGLLIAASLWNSWPMRKQSAPRRACCSTGELYEIDGFSQQPRNW